MAHPISTIGAVHTIISLVPLIAGIYGFIRYGRIDLTTRSGKVYLITTTLAVITSFGVSSTGGLNAGHAFGIVVLLAAFGGAYSTRVNYLGRARRYLSTFALSLSFLLSLVPATNETLSRLPAAHPLATGPMSPVVQITLLIWLTIFIVGFAMQCRSLNRAVQKGASRLHDRY